MTSNSEHSASRCVFEPDIAFSRIIAAWAGVPEGEYRNKWTVQAGLKSAFR